MKIRFAVSALHSDLVSAFRSLRRRPLAAALSIVSLGVGMALATQVFGAIDALVESPPFADAKVVLRVYAFDTKRSQEAPGVSARHLQALRETPGPWAQVAGARAEPPLNLGASGSATSVNSISVTSNFFQTIGIRMALGQPFDETAEMVGAPTVAIVSYSIWHTHLGSPTDLANSFVVVNGHPLKVVGVLPLGYSYPFDADIWLPISRDKIRNIARNPEFDWPRFMLLGRSKSVPLETIAAWSQIVVDRTDADLSIKGSPRVHLRTVADAAVRDGITESSVWIAIAALVLFLCATNFATGFLGSAMRRRRELAIRSATGASTNRLVQLFLFEAVLLGLAGGVAASLFSVWITGLTFATSGGPLFVSLRIIVFGVLGTIVVGVVFGIPPILQLCRGDLKQYMVESATPTASRLARDRGALVGLQIGLAVICVSSVAALVYADARFASFGPGYDYSRVVTASVTPSNPSAQAISESQLVGLVRGIPGVRSAALVRSPEGERGAVELSPEKHVNRVSGVPWVDASEGFFTTLGVSPTAGRVPTREEISSRSPVAVLSASAALNIGENPIGTRIRLRDSHKRSTWLTVIGVVPDIRRGPDFSIFDTPVFTSLSLPADSTPQKLMIRVSTDAIASLAPLKNALGKIDMPVIISDVKLVSSDVESLAGRARQRRSFLGVISFVSFVLASIGAYGLSSYVAAARAKEMYIRLALGASRSNVILLILRTLMAMALAGSVFGLLIASRFADIMNIVLWGQRGSPAPLTRFPLTPAVSAVVLLLSVSAIGSLVPMLRVTRQNLTNGLRQ